VPSTTGERAATGLAEDVLCAWCRAPAQPSGGRLAVCTVCGAATTYPPPQADELERAYATWYRPAAGRFSGGCDRVLALSRASLARRLDRIAPPGPMLDVGSGDGVLLRALRVRGREAVGLERAAHGDGVLACEINEFEDRQGGWAAVVFWHSLEHLQDPAGALDRAAALLAPGGMLVVAVPNLGSWQARYFGERWFHLDLPRHLVHLPASALSARVQARGFLIQRRSHWRGGQILFGWLYGIVRMLPGHPDLYSAIRRVGAQDTAIAGGRRAAVLLAAVAAAPLAGAMSAAEITAHAGGTVYLEARRR
jgi:SAM-dependent methyltransferase